MLIRCWGARGSIPVSGKEYSKYGGSTTCLEIRSKNDDVIIVDAGSGIRKRGVRLLKEGKKEINILFTPQQKKHFDLVIEKDHYLRAKFVFDQPGYIRMVAP